MSEYISGFYGVALHEGITTSDLTWGIEPISVQMMTDYIVLRTLSSIPWTIEFKLPQASFEPIGAQSTGNIDGNP